VADFVEKKIGDLTVKIDRGLCIASSNCINVAGEKFELDNEGIVAFRDDAQPLSREMVIEACASCPVDALIVLDADGNQIVPD
jgi:ferredoxin